MLHSEKSKAIKLGFATTALFLLALSAWLYFDKHVPACDEANHVLNGLTYANLLEHARPWRLSFWHSFFSVNTYYPPIGTLAMGIAMAVCHNATLSLQIVKLFWLTVLSGSVGVMAFSISGRSTAVGAAISLVNMCILTCDFSHSALIDQPLTAMVAAGLAAIYWKGGKSTVKHSLVTGIVLGLAIMSKQVAIAYLGFPLLIDAYLTYKQNTLKKTLFSLALVAAPILVLCLPWTLLNFASMQKQNQEIAVELSKRGSAAERIIFNLKYYLGSWIYCASPLVLFTAALGAISLTKETHKKLLILWFSILPAALALSLISYQPARDRYVAPLVILIAVVGGVGIAQLLQSAKKKLAYAGLSVLSMVLAVQFISFNFSPYPINLPAISSFTSLTACNLREHVSPFFDKKSVVFWQHSYPNSEAGELAGEILATIAERDGKQTISWLNITASGAGLDVHEFELLAQLQGMHIRPTTSRMWTALGDKEEFTQAQALNYRWYVLKDGDQGFRFADEQNLLSHQQLIVFIRANYKLVKSFKALDGAVVGLYRAP